MRVGLTFHGLAAGNVDHVDVDDARERARLYGPAEPLAGRSSRVQLPGLLHVLHGRRLRLQLDHQER